MILLNHPSSPLDYFLAKDIKQIGNSKPEAMPILVENLNELSIHCLQHNIPFSILAQNIQQAIFANHFGAKYLLSLDLPLAKELQQLAENYLFDTKIITLITSEQEIPHIAKLGIDGVFFITDYKSFFRG